MTGWNIPDGPSDEERERRRRELIQEGEKVIANQHVVSKVLLKEFATPSQGGSGRQVIPYNVNTNRVLKRSGVKRCGRIPHFVRYASESLEQLWSREVETHIPRAIGAVCDGTIFDKPRLVRVLKDCIALHLVRSPRFLSVHKSSFEQAALAVKDDMISAQRPILEREFTRLHGISAAGRGALEIVVEHYLKPWRDWEEEGLLERESIEYAFGRIRGTFDNAWLEIWQAPISHEFLIADSPAFTFDNSGGSLRTHMAIGDSSGVAMPISRKLMICIGREDKIEAMSPDLVEVYNALQVIVAFEHVFYHPAADMESFIRSTLKNYSRDSGVIGAP